MQAYINWFITHPVLAFILLFIQYAVLMTYQSRLKNSALGKPLFLWFIWQDWLMNFMMTFLFLDPPGNLTEVVTGRMERYKSTFSTLRPITWLDKFQYGFAVRLCKILNRFDENHC